MAYRRRDSSRSAYSYADAYRTLSSPTVQPDSGNPPPSAPPSSTGHGHIVDSSSDEGGIVFSSTKARTAVPGGDTALDTVSTPGRVLERTSPSPQPQDYAPRGTRPTRGRENERMSPEHDIIQSGRDDSPLSPPRPSFLAGSKRAGTSSSDRASWSSSANDSVSAEPTSDSESGPTPESSTHNLMGNAQGGTGTLQRRTTRSRAIPAATTGRIIPRPRAHHRRRFTLDDGRTISAGSASPTSSSLNPFSTPTSSVYISNPIGMVGNNEHTFPGNVRPPPSSFAFPFQSHPGNPDPGMSIPGVARRSSFDSFRNRPRSAGSIQNTKSTSLYQVSSGYQSIGDLSGEGLGKPNAPFMTSGEGREGSPVPSSPNTSQSNIYRGSAAGALNSEPYTLPRTNSVPTITMRAPFLSPASRPSSLWSPPAYPSSPGFSGSLPYLPSTGSPAPPYAKKSKSVMPSTRLDEKLTKEDKPWLARKDSWARLGWWLTLLCWFLGVGAAGVVMYFGWMGVNFLKDEDLCMVLNESFDNLDLDNTWTRDVQLGGFGNGEFQMTTDSSDNLFTQDGQLYIVPTFTSDEIGEDAVKDGYNYTLSGCTVSDNATACTVNSDASQGLVINPVKSARISTQGHYDIQFGKVEVRAKNPRGDWLWPAIWMLPTDDSVYGPWPIGGEIDIMEARGNGPTYPAQGNNFVRSSLNYGVLAALQTQIFGWWTMKQSTFSDAFHVYTLEWTPDWMRFYVDNRLQAMINLKITGKGGKSFFDRGKYPPTAHNGSETQVVVEDIWSQKGGSAAAPYDQSFYLILDLAVGGTSGWFPDKAGDKPWFDASGTAMRDFAYAQDTWSATWPSDINERAFRIDYVKMWKLGRC